MQDQHHGASPAAFRGNQLSFLSRIFGGKQPREAYRALYNAIVNGGRDTAWYLEGQVPDTIDGRFDMISSVLALVLVRLEADEPQTRTASVLLAELFIEDMDRSIRELGTGDVVVGKRIGKMMGMLGGRIGAFRSAIEQDEDFTAPVIRNVFRDAPPSPEAVAFVSSRLRGFYTSLEATDVAAILRGELPSA
jgi:cytochrome b pre-mRNA-processing protein 3